MKKSILFFISILTLVFAQKTSSITLRPIQTPTDSVFVINSTKDLYYIKVKTNTGAILGGVNLAMNPVTGVLSLTIGGSTYTANLGTSNDFESATYSSATGEITLTSNNGTNTVLTIDGSETKLIAGDGITVTGNGTSATPYEVEALDISPTNELQTLGLSGHVLSISGGNSLNLPNTSPVLVASNDLFISGGNLQTGAPLVQNTETQQNGFARSFTGGNFGLGTPFPNNTFEVNSGFLDSTGVRFTQVTKYTPKSAGETAYLAVNGVGNIVVGEAVSGCPDTVVSYKKHQFVGVTNSTSTTLGWDFSNFVIDPQNESIFLVFSDNNGSQNTNLGAVGIPNLLSRIIDFYTNTFQPATGNTTVIGYEVVGSFGYITITGAIQNNLQMQIRNDQTGLWGIGNDIDPNSDGFQGAIPSFIGSGLGECEIIDLKQKVFNFDTDSVFYFSGGGGTTQILNGTYMGWSFPLGVQWANPFLSGDSYFDIGVEIETDGLGNNFLPISDQSFTSISEYVALINAQAAAYGSSFRVQNVGNDYIFFTDLAGNPILSGDPYLVNNQYSNFLLALRSSTNGWLFEGYNPKDLALTNFNYTTGGAMQMYYGHIPSVCEQIQSYPSASFNPQDSILAIGSFSGGDFQGWKLGQNMDNSFIGGNSFTYGVTVNGNSYALQGNIFATFDDLLNSIEVMMDVLGYYYDLVAFGDTSVYVFGSGANPLTDNIELYVQDNTQGVTLFQTYAQQTITLGSLTGCYKTSLEGAQVVRGALNGLKLVGKSVRLGGALDSNTDINTSGNTLSITSGIANSAGLRFPNLTSSSPTSAGGAIGVDASGNVVRVATASGGITSFGGQTGSVQTLSVTNTTAARAWTSIANDHSLNLRAWDLNGNGGTNQAVNFVGTTDAQDLVFRTNNLEKLRITQAGRLLLSNTGGGNLNTFLGQNTGNESNSGGNVGIGANALQLVSTGIVNTAVGVDALKSLTTGTRNAAFGYLAGSMLQSGSFNTALGMNSMLNSVSASNTIGIGFQAFNNFNGTNSVAIGSSAGNMQTSGTNNIFIGANATTGNVSNTASNQLNLNSWIYGDNGKIGLNGKLIPESNLVVNGSFATNVQTVTTSTVIGASAYTVLVNNGATGITLTLPNAALFPARIIVIARIDNTSTGAVTINSAGGQVQALARTMGATTTLSANGTNGDCVSFQSNGTNWYRISN